MPDNNYPKHQRTHFYKYTSARTALLILRNRTFRYSSPVLFNDPFDIQTEIKFDFPIHNFPKLVMEEIEEIVLSKKHVELDEGNAWSKAIALLKEKVEEHGYYEDDVKSITLPMLEIMKHLLEDTRQKYNEAWREFLPRLRVFSVSEKKDNILMWSHYADYHTGVVLKLDVLPEEDNPLCVAKPVIYRPTPPIFFTEREWIDDIIGAKEIDHQKLYWEYAYVKSDIWGYENEWRVWDLLPDVQSRLYSDYPVYPKELDEIYFGCRIREEDRKAIVLSAKSINPEIRFFQGIKSNDQYGLDFKEI